MDLTDWSPERKVVGAAIATIIMAVAGVVWPEIDMPIGVEGAIAVVVAYLIPGGRKAITVETTKQVQVVETEVDQGE